MLYPFVKQEQIDDCAYACLSMLINYHHQKNISISEIKLNHSAYNHALSVYELQQIGKSYNLNLNAYHVNNTDFTTLKITDPIIAYCLNQEQMYHFVVVYQKTRTKVLIADPSDNKIKWVKIDVFLKSYQGVILFANKIADFKFKSHSILNIFVFLKPFVLLISTLLIVSILINILVISNKSFIKLYVNEMVKQPDNNVSLIFFAFFILSCLKIVFAFLFKKMLFHLQTKVFKTMFDQFINKLNLLQIEQFDQFSKADWIKRIEDLSILSGFITTICFNLVLNGLMMIFATVLLISVSVMVFLIVLAGHIVCFVISLIFCFINRHYFYQAHFQNLQFQQSIIQYIESFNARKVRNLDHYFANKLIDQNQLVLKSGVTLNQVDNLQTNFLSFIEQIISFLIFFFSLKLIGNNTLTAGDTMFYYSLSFYFADFSSSLASFLAMQPKINESYNRISQILKQQQESGLLTLNQEVKTIDIKNLTYKYNEQTLFSKVNLTFNNHNFIHGKLGLGKTTLFNILAKSKINYQGEVIVNNYELKQYNSVLFYEKIVFLQQHDYIFSGTVWENIANFSEIKTTSLFQTTEIQSILINSKIDLTKNVVNNGENLSRGQRQIINFINLLARDCEVYIIDEALSNVDQATKQILISLLIKLKHDKLIIYYDHDLSYQKYFQNIIDLNAILLNQVA